MKADITFTEEERAAVEALITQVKKVLRITRLHSPKQSKDGVLHVYLKAEGR